MTEYKLGKKGVDALIQLHKIARDGKNEVREDFVGNSLTRRSNHETLEAAYKQCEKSLTKHHLHRLFFAENLGRCIQITVNRIAEDNGEKIGYSLEMLDITQVE